MKLPELSNKFILLPAFSVLALSACMQDQVTTNYASTVPNYEDKVEVQSIKEALASPTGQAYQQQAQQQASSVPVIVNNAYAQGNAMVAAAAQPVPVSVNPYGSLDNNVIQSGVFTQSYTPYQQAPSYGANVYSPTTKY